MLFALLAFLRHSNPIRRHLSPKEVRRTKVVEVLCGEGAAERPLYLVLSQLDEAWGAHRLRGFAEIRMGSYHAYQTQ